MSEIIEAEYRELMPERLGIIAAEIRTLSQSVFWGVIEIGKRFEEAKSLCPHGKWGEWVQEVTGYKQSMAENYIKVFKEYGGGQINIGGDFANSQSFANLGITKLLELTAVPPEEREEFVKENDVENMSVSELRELLALEKRKNEESAKRRVDLEKSLENAEAQTQKLKVEMEMYQDQIAGLEEQLENNNDAEISQSELDRFHREAEKAVREETEKSIKALQEKLDKNNEKIEKLETEKKKLKDKLKSEADKVRAEEAEKVKAAEEKAQKATAAAEDATAEIERLKKELDMSDPAVTEFRTLFNAAQDSLDKLGGALKRIANKETADKLKGAVDALVKKYSTEVAE